MFPALDAPRPGRFSILSARNSEILRFTAVSGLQSSSPPVRVFLDHLRKSQAVLLLQLLPSTALAGPREDAGDGKDFLGRDRIVALERSW
jgi:hypothetical protein